MFGAPKKCAKCDKLVYSIEELKCLDKIWHKNCFKCSVCSSLLNMKNYKGFDKQPYCYVHYPQQKHTVVSDNPEMIRIKENTKIQSNAKYHEDFEKNKGIYTVVADDPETRRVLENSKIISQVKYHEDFEKNIKNKYTPVLDNPETQRAIENQKIVSSVEYKGIKNQNNQNSNHQLLSNISNGYTNNKIISQPAITTYKSGEKLQVEAQNQRKIGSIADYDPLNYENSNQQQFHQANHNNHHSASQYYNHKDENSNFKNHQDNELHKQQQQQQQQQLPNRFNDIKTSVYRAIYDYDAKEDDEISFRDGDKFINCEQIDVGWMIGVHEKTGKHGMFPANYAEPIDLF